MAEAVHANVNVPIIKHVDRARLPLVVAKVMADIQKLMMDDVTHTNRQETIPSMPTEFLCSEVVDDNKKDIMTIAGEDKIIQSKYPELFRIIVPHLMKHPPSNPLHLYIWSGNVLAINGISAAKPDLVVVIVKGGFATKMDASTGKNVPEYFSIGFATDMKDIPLKSLKDFYQSSLVSKQPSGDYMISSNKMTITWLRGHLDKALHMYREVQKDVEVIATIKQKDGGPLFLRLQVEKKEHYSSTMTRYKYLFMFCPALRVSQCQLIVPVFSLLDTDVFPNLNTSSKYCLWKKITICDETSHFHVHKLANFVRRYGNQFIFPVLGTVKQITPKTVELEAYKASIDKNCKLMTSTQQGQCQQCDNSGSRMLLEYYYQYSYIPDNEMSQATSFVWEILKFLKASIEEDQKSNEPNILEFVESGSVSEELKVVQPDEFDVMITIDLPDSTECYTFLEDNSFPTGYAICKVRRSKSYSRSLQRCFRKSNEFGHCLAPEQLAFGWLYSKLELAINKYRDAPEANANLKVKRSGPALLLEITPWTSSKLPRKISVDLVLALKLSKDDSRYAVAKRAKVEQFYKKVFQERKATGEDGHYARNNDNRKGVARKNLKYLWRISYSAQEKRYLEYVKEIQLQANGVVGCQNICLMILKTICTREILKREESVIYHKLSSYILKTALFHVLAKSDLMRDWRIDCLADRYIDLLDELSKWQELPHFFFDNAANLRKVFPHDQWCENTTPKNLLDELHATLKIQLLHRFVDIANTFKKCKQRMDVVREKVDRISSECWDYNSFLVFALLEQTPEEVIHPPFNKYAISDEASRKLLVEKVSEDSKVGKAAKAERKGGPLSDQDRNLDRPEEDEMRSIIRQLIKEDMEKGRGNYNAGDLNNLSDNESVGSWNGEPEEVSSHDDYFDDDDDYY